MSLANAGPERLDDGAVRLFGARRGDYPLPAKILHWITAALVLAMVSSGVIMTQLADGPTADLLNRTHKLTGVTVLGLIVLRLLYRLVWNIGMRVRGSEASRRAHQLLYAILIVTPLLGWAGASAYDARIVLFGIELPAIWPAGSDDADALLLAHRWLAFGLVALVFVHIGLALQTYITRGHED